MKFSLSIFIFIFSFPLISAPDNFSLACDAFEGRKPPITIGCSNKDNDFTDPRYKKFGFCRGIPHGDERIKKFTFNYINDPSVSNIPRIDLFAKITRHQLKDTIWIERSFNYAESSENFHFFGIKNIHGDYELSVNRQSLFVILENSVRSLEQKIKGTFDFCNLIDPKKVDEIRKSILIDKKNVLEEIEEEEKRIKEKIKSSQKI